MAERFQAGNFQLGGSFVQDISGFQKATSQIGSFFAEKGVRKAAQEGAEPQFDEEGQPVLPEQKGSFFRSSRAFNEASIKAYQASIQNDVMENIARIQAENPNDPEAFQKAIDGFKIGLFADIADPVRSNITQLFDNLETRARISVQADFTARVGAENKVLAEKAQTGFKNQALSSLFNGDIIGFETAKNSFVESLDNPLFSPEEAADRIKAFDDQSDETQLLGAVDRLFDEDPRKALIALSAFQNMDPTEFGFSPQRQNELVAKGFSSVLNRTKLSEQIETVGDQETERNQDVAEADLTAKAYSGELSQAEFLEAINGRSISPAAADRIKSRMNSTFAIKDDPGLILSIERDLPDLSTPEVEALLDTGVDNGQLTAATASRLQRAVNTRDEKDEDEVIKINRDLLKGFLKEQGIFSKFDPQSEKRLAAGLADYNLRVRDGEEPRAVMLDVLKNNGEDNEIVLKTLPPLRFGSVDNLSESETLTIQALDAGDITESEAERQLELIQIMDNLKLGIRKP